MVSIHKGYPVLMQNISRIMGQPAEEQLLHVELSGMGERPTHHDDHKPFPMVRSFDLNEMVSLSFYRPFSFPLQSQASINPSISNSQEPWPHLHLHLHLPRMLP